MIIDYLLIGMKVHEIRLSAKFTQEMLAKLSDLSPIYISNIKKFTQHIISSNQWYIGKREAYLPRNHQPRDKTSTFDLWFFHYE